MYKPSSSMLRNNYSSSPILESKIISKLSAKSFMKIPKNSLAYYKKQSKTPSKKPQSSSKLRENYSSKLILSPTKTKSIKPYEPEHTLTLPSLKPEESFNRTNTTESQNRSQLISSKTTMKLLKKIKTNKINQLPKLSQRTYALKNYITNLQMRRKRNRELSATWSDNESLCGWQTDSIMYPN